jgi:cytochrome o ubiquinol oxidase subunit 2
VGKKIRLVFIVVMLLVAVLVLTTIISHINGTILNPKGAVAVHERNLIVTAISLMLVVVIPIFILMAVFGWKYRASNKSAKYTPDWNTSKLQIIWWAIPAVIIFTLAVLNWKSTHELDPYRPLTSTTKPITIQVVALRWKWLFIYPEQNIATVNYIRFPEKTPVDFELTANAPMSSFWIPSLGGQMYAMNGMVTKLHLIADTTGKFAGSAAEINGAGFSGMKFTAQASNRDDFDEWVKMIKQTPHALSETEYKNLEEPSENSPATYYSSVDKGLYNEIVRESNVPTGTQSTDMGSMEH